MSVWSYEGKRVVIAGCFSGMGEATARELVRLGGEVHGLDVKESPVDLASFRTCDLRDPTAIEEVVADIGGPVDALFNCAGLPQTFPPLDVMKVNFIGTRHLTEQVVPLMRRGSAIATISSTAGCGFLQRIPQLLEFVNTPAFDDAVAWCEEHPGLVDDGYAWSKETLIVWTMSRASQLIERGIRLNCVSPGPTETPMMPEFEQAASKELIDVFTWPIQRRSRPEEQAYPLIFLNSDAASFVNGHNFNVDGGFVGGALTGQIDVLAAMAEVLGDAAIPS